MTSQRSRAPLKNAGSSWSAEFAPPADTVVGVHRIRCLAAALAMVFLVLAGCGSPSADDIARALEADGADEAAARCVADQAIASDLSTDSLRRLAEEGITDDDGQDVQFLEDDTAILQALVTACLN